jgi:hypothetical protein
MAFVNIGLRYLIFTIKLNKRPPKRQSYIDFISFRINIIGFYFFILISSTDANQIESSVSVLAVCEIFRKEKTKNNRIKKDI